MLRGKNTRIVLYTYDSFLLDVDNLEQEIIEKIYSLLQEKGLNFKIKSGKNYNF